MADIKECNVHETGHCALHGIEVERRKNTQDELKEYKQYTAELLTFKNMTIGIGVLAGTVLFGGIIYTYEHIQSSDTELAAMRTQLTKLSADYARTDERYIAVTAQLGQLNGRVGQLVEILLDGRMTKHVDVLKEKQ